MCLCLVLSQTYSALNSLHSLGRRQTPIREVIGPILLCGCRELGCSRDAHKGDFIIQGSLEPAEGQSWAKEIGSISRLPPGPPCSHFSPGKNPRRNCCHDNPRFGEGSQVPQGCTADRARTHTSGLGVRVSPSSLFRVLPQQPLLITPWRDRDTTNKSTCQTISVSSPQTVP